MSEVSAESVKELRQISGAGMMDCKKALAATGGNIEKAVDWLREKGIASAAKKASRVTSEGVISSYIHGAGRIGVLVEVNCETDFVAKNEDFQQYVKDICLQIAASKPLVVRRDELDPAVIEKERAVLMAQAAEEGKPEHIRAKMVDGRIEKWVKEVALLDQPFVKDPEITVQRRTENLIAKIGENISVRRFVRYEVGEGLEKKKSDFAAEVAAQAGK
ncbi:MAG: Elongation factor Ts [Myxococcota bacterium]|nr:Elongation factor Ts [Myxococcota bacterium]